MRRKLGWLLVLALLVGGAAACGDDDGDGGDTTTTTEEGGSDSGGGNEAIQAFCDSVQELVDKAAELRDDPTNAELQQEVSDLTTQLGTDAGELSGQVGTFTPEEAEEFQGCQTDLTGATTGG